MSTRTHFTWSIETPDGCCPYCGARTFLIYPYAAWKIDEESAVEAIGEERYEADYGFEDCEFLDEVSGHYCPNCERLVSLSLNTAEVPR